MNWETLICFGDSITAGARSYLGYPEYSADLLQKEIGNSWDVLNISVSGFTTCDLLRKVTTDGYNIAHYNPSFFTLLIGTNDVKKSTSLNDFRIAYNLIVLKIRLLVKHKNGILILIPKFRKGLKFPYEYNMNKKIKKFNNIIAEVGKKYGLDVLKLELEDGHFFDGIHLNKQGSIEVAVQLTKYIMKKKGIDPNLSV